MTSSKLINNIKKNIAVSEEGYLYFDQFMEISLYSDKGFFNSGSVRSSRSGDFLTSPEVSEYFGKVIFNWIKKNFNETKLQILELGAGTGKLSKDIANSNQDRDLIFNFVEKSDPAIDSISKLFPKSSIVKTLDDLQLLEDTKLVVIGNEILDNIPCAIALVDKKDWKEKAVKVRNNKLEYCLVKPREETTRWINDNYENEKPDFEVEIQTNAEAYLDKVINMLNPDAVLLFDYGYLQEERIDKPYNSLLRTYQDHHLGPDPILFPGETDITYDINFTSLLNMIDGELFHTSIRTQRDFLFENGLGELITKLTENRSNEKDLELIKTNSDLLSMKTISDENGLGSFYTFVSVRK